MNYNGIVLFAVLLLSGLTVFAGEKAHVHGVAKLQVAVDNTRMEVVLVSPLDSLIGFERAPRNEKERKAVREMLATFTNPAALLQPSAAAGCRTGPAAVTSPISDATSKPKTKQDAHAELEAVVTFECDNPAALRGMEVRLFQRFPGIERIQAEVVTAKGQRASTLTSKQRALSW